MNRSKPQGDDVANWLKRRNTQCNLDTILQVISLRSQPEIKRFPHKVEFRFDEPNYFGFLYEQQEDTTYNYWKFEFEVQHASVFEDITNPFGALHRDCEGVPMILVENQHPSIPKLLDISPELKNIYFEVL
jgi:hypothetical protein